MPPHDDEEPVGLPELTERLRRKSRRVTGPRQAVLEALRRGRHPMAVRDIHAALGGHECDLATVYRSLRLLEEMGMVKRFDFGDGQARFELLREGDDGHHHHLVCKQCSEVIELGECWMEDLEQRIALKSGFKGITHKLEFFGLCPQCQ